MFGRNKTTPEQKDDMACDEPFRYISWWDSYNRAPSARELAASVDREIQRREEDEQRRRAREVLLSIAEDGDRHRAGERIHAATQLLRAQ